ncbi:amidohydrolase [Aureibacter tunicatorum]|uniref:Amidohydrolase 3 domain-containing protein n=1 Tax=Aureibacter tunicatorum TaxID=866807 RepID=A0AAE3XSX7_9BACT|nr:amidohydrolase family protein [Aureibacter tunicatorum]MDR6241439.1 hypothetical protein [Aureibacter tunicatorum]BDD06716.1 exoenzyme regulatory protein AepA precursor [Aureibacter tunicatorum]
MESNHQCKEHDCHMGCGCYNPAVHMIDKNSKKVHKDLKPLPPIFPKDNNSLITERHETVCEGIIFYGGIIRPIMFEGQLDAKRTVEAMAIENGVIKNLGEFSNLSAMYPEFKKVNIGGKTILPGMIEPHCHIIPSSILLESGFWIDLSPFADQSLLPSSEYKVDKAIEKLKSGIETLEQNSDYNDFWLLAQGLDTSLLEDWINYDNPSKNILNLVDNSELDKVSTTRPVMVISASLHTLYVNSIALEVIWEKQNEESLNNNPQAKEFIKKYPSSDIYKNNKGILQEIEQMAPALESLPDIQNLSIQQTLSSTENNSIRSFFKTSRSRGVTMVYDAGMTAPWAENYLKYKSNTVQSGMEWGIRIGMAYAYNDSLLRADAEKQVLDFTQQKFKFPTKETINAYWGSVKLVGDGSNQGLTGYQSQPYSCPTFPPEVEPYFGIFNFKDDASSQHTIPNNQAPDYFKNLVTKISLNGWPLMIHANGNQTVKYTLQAFQQAYKAFQELNQYTAEKYSELRHRIEHCSLLDSDDIEVIKKLRLNPSYLIGHVGYWGYVFSSYIFNREIPSATKDQNIIKVNELDLCKSTSNENCPRPITLHSDCAVSPIGPLRNMEQAYTRFMESDYTNRKILNASEKLNASQALEVITYNAAWQCHAEQLVGSLEVGKLSDFVILEQDPLGNAFDTPEKAYQKLRYIKVKETWVGKNRFDYTIASPNN